MKYIVISGNTGAGKSTLIKNLSRLLATEEEVQTIDESSFHHPEILRMFQRPAVWALPIQVYFPLMRWTKLTQLQEDNPNCTVIMERCLLEDPLFFRYYLQQKRIPSEAAAWYSSMVEYFGMNSPKPTLIVHLRGSEQLLTSRLERSFDSGDRPQELRGADLFEYVRSMNNAYTEWAGLISKEFAYLGLWIEDFSEKPDDMPISIIRALKSF